MTYNLHRISPRNVLRGETAWKEGKHLIKKLCKKPLLLGRSESTQIIRQDLLDDLKEIGVKALPLELSNDCCEEDLSKSYSYSKSNSVDALIATGGGKVLDSGKLLAERLRIPCITIPLSASTCAGWTSLSNIYSPEGKFIKDINLSSFPEMLIFDYKLILQAPSRTLSSGIADALAKWHESSLTSSSSTDALVQQAVQMARVLRDQLLIDGSIALENPQSESWIRVAEACGLTAGLIGGIGGAKCRTAAAHAIHNGLTQLDFPQKPLHGEIVGFGILVQLKLEELMMGYQLPAQARLQLVQFFKKLNLPINLNSLGLDFLTKEMLTEACQFACNDDSEMHYLPFSVNKRLLMDALITTHKEGSGVNLFEEIRTKSN